MKFYKSVAVLFFAMSLLTACNTSKKITGEVEQAKEEKLASSTTETKEIPESKFLKWDKTHVNLGSVKRGEKRETFFEFTNIYTDTLKIEIISACHCTALKYSEKPIAPGEKCRIDAIFDSTEKEVSETIYIDVIFENEDPITTYPIVEQVTYYFEIE